MKIDRSLLMLALFAACASSGCHSKTEAEKEGDKLARLKKERAQLDAQIGKLEQKLPDTGRAAVAVSVMEVQPTVFRAFVEVQAQITGDDNVNATPQMPGVVKSVLVRPGQHVQKGQVMAELDVATVEQQLKAQEAQLSLARTLYEKQQKLWSQNIGTEVQLLQARANYEAQSKQREATIAQRNMFRVVAPITGTVDQVTLKQGDAAAPGSPMGYIRVVNNQQLKAQANLGENYLGKVGSGDPVQLQFPDINDSFYTQLTYVAQAIDPVSRSFSVEVRLGAHRNLHPNMSCRMKIANYTRANTLTVPASVVQKTSSGDQVYIADGKRAKSVIIQTGRTSGGLVEVTGGLSAGDKVITKGFEDLDNGEKIAIQ